MSAVDRAERWISHDPDPKTQAELRAIVDKAKAGDAAAEKALADRFAGPLEFGTAGLRGVLGAGESLMNLAVVRRTTFGLGRYLLADPKLDVKNRGVVIGYDGRRMSREFSEEAARVLAALEIPTFVSPGVCPTPVAAYATTRLDAAAGIMVTASHNPPEYNGYKVYWGNGAQIIPPHDTGIAAEIAEAPEADAVPLAEKGGAAARALIRSFPEDLEPSYLDKVQALSIGSAGDRTVPIVYTPLHGVGNRLIRATLERAGFTNVHSVPEQAEPDGEFPTVAFPNPEEKGALDLSYALAEKVGADIILASDPDVDRLAVAIRRQNGKFLQLTGNQVGVLLGHYLLTEGPKEQDRLVLASCVSSPQLGDIARELGVHYEETLTGFKWIANRAMELENEKQYRFVFGYEEALGYTVGSLVRDKDGIGAALLFAELYARRRSERKSMFDVLDGLAREYGHYASGQLAITMKGVDGIAKIQSVMKSLREKTIDKVGPLAVLSMTDVSKGIRVAKGETTKIPLPPSDVLFYELEAKCRIIARPSGTEPKLKIYFDVREPMKKDEPLVDAEARAQARMSELKKAFAAIAGLEASL